jgi:hypothetical protein
VNVPRVDIEAMVVARERRAGFSPPLRSGFALGACRMSCLVVAGYGALGEGGPGSRPGRGAVRMRRGTRGASAFSSGSGTPPHAHRPGNEKRRPHRPGTAFQKSGGGAGECEPRTSGDLARGLPQARTSVVVPTPLSNTFLDTGSPPFVVLPMGRTCASRRGLSMTSMPHLSKTYA